MEQLHSTLPLLVDRPGNARGSLIRFKLNVHLGVPALRARS